MNLNLNARQVFYTMLKLSVSLLRIMTVQSGQLICNLVIGLNCSANTRRNPLLKDFVHVSGAYIY